MDVAIRPTTAGSTSVLSRIVIEYDALVAALRFLLSPMPPSCPPAGPIGNGR